MTIKQIEERVIEMIHREPFVPFVFELVDGQTVVIPHARLAVNETGAGFFGADGGIVDVEFQNVRAIHPFKSEVVA